LKESLFQTETSRSYPQYKIKRQYENLPLTELDLLKEAYKKNNDYNTLKKILEKELKTRQYLLLNKDSGTALSLYPSQPVIYLLNAISLNNLRKYSEAITILNTGIEYIADDKILKSKFMEQLSLSHKALGNNKKATAYYNKMLELRK
jgi:tetratricopeptide (TPR) repeat protein